MIDLPVLDVALSDTTLTTASPTTGKVFIETYGCDMNVADTEIVLGVLNESGYGRADKMEEADVILLNTCAIRDNAEKKIRERLVHLHYFKKKRENMVVGILGCMAERLRHDLLENGTVDIVVGPDEYRRVPELISSAQGGDKGIAVKLSRVETYEDIKPLRTEGISAWVSIMRGCDKFCTFCVVPFTRGRERSLSLPAITDDLKKLWDSGFKEVTLLGQNVDSYHDKDLDADFAKLLIESAKAVPQMRIRYTTSHPQDMSDRVIEAMAEYDNICEYIHLPFQSGSNRILKLMNRTYDVERYMNRIDKIRETMPNCALSTDVITGFCTETEDDHQATLDLLSRVQYDGAYMFAYSPRENTKAWKMGDDVPEEVKKRRLSEVIALQRESSRVLNAREVGKTHSVLVEGPSKRDASDWRGRSDTNKTILFPHEDVRGYVVGDIVDVVVERSTSATLFGKLV